MRISDWSSDVCSSDLPPATIEHKQRKDLALPIEPRVDIAYQGWRLSVLRERHRNGLKHLASAAVDNAERRRRIVMFGAVIVTLCSKRSEEHTSELQSLMRISYAVFCLKKKNKQ